MNSRRRLAGTMQGVLALTLLGVTPPNARPDPYELFDGARDAWSKQVYPLPLHYRVTVIVAEGTKPEREHFDAELSDDGDVRESGVSDEERQDAYVSGGVNTRLTMVLGWNTGPGKNGPSHRWTKDTGRKEGSRDYLGVPLLSPAYSFGLKLESRLQLSPSPAPSGGPTLRNIANVRARDRAYDITLVGRELLGGFDAYHLRLIPRREPQRYRLREMWIDAYTDTVLKLVVQGNFTHAPETDVPWVVTFQTVGGLTYIDTETAQAPLVFKHDRIYTQASISFDQIAQDDSSLPTLPYMEADRALREPR